MVIKSRPKTFEEFRNYDSKSIDRIGSEPDARLFLLRDLKKVNDFFAVRFPKFLRHTKKIADIARDQDARQIVCLGRDATVAYVALDALKKSGHKSLSNIDVRHMDFSEYFQNYLEKVGTIQSYYDLIRIMKYYGLKVDIPTLKRTIFVDIGFSGSQIQYILNVLRLKVWPEIKFNGVLYEGLSGEGSYKYKEGFSMSNIGRGNIICLSDGTSSKDNYGDLLESLPKQYYKLDGQDYDTNKINKPINRRFYANSDNVSKISESIAQRYLFALLRKKILKGKE